MAFEDFKIGEQIITYTDFDKVKIKAGELASASNFNRSIVDSMNRDAALEAAVTYMARSSSLYTTTNTRFLSHCEPIGSGADIVSGCYPDTNNASAEVVFADDDTFLGAAYIRSEVQNVIGIINSIDASLATNLGWSKASTANVMPTWLNDKYVTMSTKITTAKSVVGYSCVNTNYTSIANLGLKVGDVVSGSFHLETDDNLIAKGVSVNAEIHTYKYENGKYTQIKWNPGNKLSKTKYYGEVKVENVTIPEGTTHISLCIHADFNKEDVLVSLKFKNAILHKGTVCMPYIATSGGPYSLKYENAIDHDLGESTTLCWAKFTQSSLDGQTSMTTPMMLKLGSKYYGLVHVPKDYDSKGNVKFKSVCIDTTNGNSSSYGDEICIPKEYIDAYVLFAYRIRINEENKNYAIIEMAAICGATILKSTYTDKNTVAASSITNGDIYVGYGPSCGYINGPITEIRSDNEWLNDTELYIISLAKKAYTLKQSIDIDEEEDFNNISSNLITNPTGKLGYLGWTNYSTIKALHNDGVVGNGFELRATTALTSSTAIKMISNAITIEAGSLYTLWCNIFLTEDAIGEAGIGIEWYRSNGNVISKQPVPAVATNSNDYYSISLVAPTGTSYAKVYLYANEGFKATRILWSKLKLELGNASEYTEDSGAQYAVYYDKDDDMDISGITASTDIYVKNIPISKAKVSDPTINKIFIVGTSHSDEAVDSVINSSNMYFDKNDDILYATSYASKYIKSAGTKLFTKSSTTASSTSAEISNEGLTMTESYNDPNSPTKYGNVINVMGATHAGGGQLFLGWSGTDSTTENIYYRSHRDVSTGGWGNWSTVVTSTSGTIGSSTQGVYLKDGRITACGGGSIPIGTILPYCGKSAPSGFIMCKGGTVARSAHPDLANVIGNTYGGDSNNIGIPDLRGKYLMGANSTYGLGKEVPAGLPDIEGKFIQGCWGVGYDSKVTSGAFVLENASAGSCANRGDARGVCSFAASRSNSIYGKSTTVQPPAIAINYIIRG